MPNDHLDRAKSRLHNGTTNEVARAQAEATLALAFEQQRFADAAETANLIAYLNLAATIDLSWHPSESVLKAVQANVEERLGLS